MKNTFEWAEQLYDSTDVGILVVDKNRKNLFVNKHLCEMFGYSEEELLKQSSEIFHVNSESYKRFAELAFNFVINGKPIVLDYQFKCKDGNFLWMHLLGDLIENRDRVIWITIDITKEMSLKKEAEERVKFKNAQLAQIVEQTHDSIISTDLEGFITSWNRGAELLLGYKEEEVLGKHVSLVHRDADAEIFKESLTKLYKTGSYKAEIYEVTKFKKNIHVLLSLSLLKDDGGKPIGIVGYAQNITKRKKAEKKLEESNYNLKQYMDVIDKIDIGLFVVDDDYRVRYMNNTMKKWFGDQTNKTCYESVAKLNEPCPYCKIKEVIARGEKVNYNPTTPDGQSFDIVATTIKNADGTVSKMEVIRNVTDQKKAHEHLIEQTQRLHYQAHHDALTELPNRLLFNQQLEQGIEKAKRHKSKMALLFIDLDHFKEINDSLGHTVGDEVLNIVTMRLKNIIRKEDTIARLGGDEFTVLMENLKQGQDASLLAKKILDVLIEPIKLDENILYVSSSIGISLYPNDGLFPQDLLKYADAAMYKAKNEGRNNFQFYSSEMTELAFERVIMEANLREALKNEDFVVHYQPQVDARKNKIIGVEALVRWQHPTMGIISPGKFIPLAESTGLILEIDKFVMNRAMNQLQEWYAEGLSPGKLALNLTIKQLQQEDFLEVLSNMLQRSGCKAHWIELEVIEGQIMTNPQKAIKILTQISEMGIELAVDDFGTGYSSLSYLKKLPINKLKIDQSFVRELPGDSDDAAITKAVIALAKNLNLAIIAEGVETLEQKEFLVENGCDNIQGYLYAKPMAASELRALLLKGL